MIFLVCTDSLLSMTNMSVHTTQTPVCLIRQPNFLMIQQSREKLIQTVNDTKAACKVVTKKGMEMIMFPILQKLL